MGVASYSARKGASWTISPWRTIPHASVVVGAPMTTQYSLLLLLRPLLVLSLLRSPLVLCYGMDIHSGGWLDRFTDMMLVVQAATSRPVGLDLETGTTFLTLCLFLP